MIDLGLDAGSPQVLIGEGRPAFAPLQQLLLAVPVAALGPESFRRNLPRGQQQMSMRVFGIVDMDGEVHDHPFGYERLLRKGAGQLDLLIEVELDRQRNLDLARELGILAALHRLHGIP